jgi:TPR repeat protein
VRHATEVIMKILLCILAMSCSVFPAVSAGATRSSPCQSDDGLNLISRGDYRAGRDALEIASRGGDARTAFKLATIEAWELPGPEKSVEPRGFRGTRADAQQITRVLEECAKAGSIGAGLMLGTALLEGIGVPKDISKARRYFEIAAGRDDALSLLGLSAIAERTNDAKAARDFARKALERTKEFDPYYVGRLYLNGRVLPRNYGTAAAWFAEGVEQNDWRAQSSLAHMYAVGLGVPRDEKEADRLYALVRANPEAQIDDSPAIIDYKGQLPTK